MHKQKPKDPGVIRRNNNNRKRGSKFEKTIADFLGMEVVPYSGSNARFGYGDVRSKGENGAWLGECKNISSADDKITIKISWLNDIIAKAADNNRLPFLAWMASGKPNKYIILNKETFKFHLTRYTSAPFNVEIAQKSVNNHNIIIPLKCWWILKLFNDKGIARIHFDGCVWYMMRVELFKHIITEYDNDDVMI